MSDFIPPYDSRTVREWVSFTREYSVQWQSVFNGAARLSGRRRNVDQATYWIGLDIPPGRQLVVWSDALKLSENEYDIDIYDAPDGFTGGTNGVKRCLCGATGTVQTNVVFGVTPENESTHAIRLEDFVDTGLVQGPGRPSVAPLVDGVFQVLTTPTLMRITRQGAGQSYTLSYRVIAWERDANA